VHGIVLGVSETEAIEALEVEDGEQVYEMETEIVYDLTEGNIRNYMEIDVDAGSDNASLYFEGFDDDGRIVGGRQYLDANELRALIQAAEKALDVIEANS